MCTAARPLRRRQRGAVPHSAVGLRSGSSWDLELGHVRVLVLGLGCFSRGFGVELLPSGDARRAPVRGRRCPSGEHASPGRAGAAVAAGTHSGHQGRGGLTRAQDTEALLQPRFLPAAFFSALKPPSPRAVSRAGPLGHEGFGSPAANLKPGCWWHARGSLGWRGAARRGDERADVEPLRRLSPSSPDPPEPPREESAP